jgi:hypothetical protein
VTLQQGSHRISDLNPIARAEFYPQMLADERALLKSSAQIFYRKDAKKGKGRKKGLNR